MLNHIPEIIATATIILVLIITGLVSWCHFSYPDENSFQREKCFTIVFSNCLIIVSIYIIFLFYLFGYYIYFKFK